MTMMSTVSKIPASSANKKVQNCKETQSAHPQLHCHKQARIESKVKLMSSTTSATSTENKVKRTCRYCGRMTSGGYVDTVNNPNLYFCDAHCGANFRGERTAAVCAAGGVALLLCVIS